tara:strand:+ start:172 stop:459 length:288 start_codon:yes stop_codon:yes gene_type:complete
MRNKSQKLYAYDITEQSVDVRRFKVVSDKPLNEETVEEIYRQVSECKDNTTEDVSEYASELEETKVRATTTFEYTDFGDDCQVDVSDVYEEETDE